MKTTIKYFLILAFTSLFLTSCEDYSRKAEGKIKETAPVLKMAQNGVWLRDSTENFVDKFLMRINWTEARFTHENGVPAKVGAVKYILEIDAADFTKPVILAETSGLFADLFSGKLRNELINWYGGEIDTTKYISFRVKTLCENFEPTFSNIMVLQVFPTKPEDIIVGPPVIPDITIRIRKSAECTWTNIFVYAWGAEEVYGAWSGKMLDVEELNGGKTGWYYFVVPGVRPLNLILNNGGGGAGNQFDFISSPTEDGCYEITNSAATKINCE